MQRSVIPGWYEDIGATNERGDACSLHSNVRHSKAVDLVTTLYSSRLPKLSLYSIDPAYPSCTLGEHQCHAIHMSLQQGSAPSPTRSL